MIATTIFLEAGNVAQWVWGTSLEATLLIAVVFLIGWAAGLRLPPRWRYGLGLLILARLVLPITLPGAWGFNTLVPDDISEPRWTQGGGTFEQSRNEVITTPVIVESPEVQAQVPADAPSSPAAFWSIPGLWAAGVFLVFGVTVARMIRFTIRIRGAVPVERADSLELLDDCCANLGVTRAITMLQLQGLGTPALYGVFRPRLLLPQGFLDRFSRQEIRLVFLHELAHLKAHDILLNWLIAMAGAIHWFNPVTWLALRRLRQDREILRDSQVLHRLDPNERATYGQTLLKLSEQLSGGVPCPSFIPVINHRSQITRRILMITRYRRESRASNIVLAAVVVVLALVTFSTPGSGLAAEQTLRATSSYALSEDFRYVRDGKALLELIPIRSATAPTTAASAATANTPADAAAVRSILTNPPALEYYEYEVLPDARFLHQRASRGDITTGLHVYRGRSRDAEANWTQFRPKESLDLDTEPSLFVGRFKGITWHAAGDYLTVLGEETALRTHAYGCARMLTRLGLPGVDFEHATWDGASFNSTEHFCASTPFEWSMRVTGQIRQLAPGRFEIVITDAATGTITARVLLNYAPDSNNTQFPRTIEIARNFDSHEDTCLVLVSEARVASTVLPDELFDPRKMSEVGRRIEIKQRPMP